MKKSTFTILFVLIIFSLFYTPNSYSAQDSSSCSKYTSSNCPSSQCELKSSTVSKPGCKTSKTVQTCVQSTNPNNQNPNEECPYDQNTLSDKNKRVSANFNYEGKITSGWEFGLNGNNLVLYHPVIYSTQSPPNMESVQVNEIYSNGNCKYYSFNYQRPSQTLTYNLPSQSSTPQNINGELSCLYNKYSIREGPSRISLIPGNPVTNIDQVCPELKKLPSPVINPPSASPPLSPPSCPPNTLCTVQVQKGPEESHGFIVKTTDCGQEVIMDNSGSPIQEDLLQNNAIVALSSCSDDQNPTQNTAQNKCGNGIVDEGEECDEKEKNGKSFCSSECKIEEGWTCYQNDVKKVECFQIKKYGNCANGKGCTVEEGCKDGSTCKEISDSEQKKLCGKNKNVDPWEECDDDNNKEGDGCSSECKIERGWKCIKDDVDDLSICTKIMGSCVATGRQCTIIENSCGNNDHCIFSENTDNVCEDFCVGGTEIELTGLNPSSKNYICKKQDCITSNKKYTLQKCPTGNICISGKCTAEKKMGENNLNKYDPKKKTIIYVPGVGKQNPDEIRQILNECGDKYNFILYPYNYDDRTKVPATGLNNLIKDLMAKYPDLQLKIISHSNGHVVTRLAVLLANGLSPEGNIEKDEEVSSVYSRSEVYSVSGIIGGEHSAFNAPPGIRWNELNPSSTFQNWLYDQAHVDVFNNGLNGYHSYVAKNDPHFIEIWTECNKPNISGKIKQMCDNYFRGISEDHQEFDQVDESLISNPQRYTRDDANAILKGLSKGFGIADKDFCNNRLLTYTFLGKDASHVALLSNPKVISDICKD